MVGSEPLAKALGLLVQPPKRPPGKERDNYPTLGPFTPELEILKRRGPYTRMACNLPDYVSLLFEEPQWLPSFVR